MKAAIEQVREQYAFSERRACGLLRLSVSTLSLPIAAQR